MNDLKGRHIEDVPYSGLVERLNMITLMCHTAGEAKNVLSKDDLMSIISQIVVAATEGLAFAGVTEAENREVTAYLLSGMHVDREQPN